MAVSTVGRICQAYFGSEKFTRRGRGVICHTRPPLLPSAALSPSRGTRIAESQYLQDAIAAQGLRFPTVVIPGAAHASFLSGYPPLLVRSRDLRPEASEASVHAAVASLFTAFVLQIITDAPAHLPPLAQAVAASSDFFAPIQSACVTCELERAAARVKSHW